MAARRLQRQDKALGYVSDRVRPGSWQSRRERSRSGSQTGIGGFQESFVVLVRNLLHPFSGLKPGRLQSKHPLRV